MQVKAALLALLALVLAVPAGAARAGEYELVIDEKVVNVTGRPVERMTVNGTIPGPVLRWREGEDVTIRVTNRMRVPSSLHWHGLILPPDQDGAPGFSGFKSIPPGGSFTYRFPIQQAGTYWYHSHDGTQEQGGLYGPIVIEPKGGPKAQADRDYVVVLSDFTHENTDRILNNLKVDPGYYNYGHRTLGDFFRDARRFGFGKALKDRRGWGGMRMDPTDIADVTGYTFLVNGKPPTANETFLFRPGERVRLRFINASAMSYYDVRIPGLPMTVVGADGRDLEPVEADEFRLAVAETYDVIVEPKAEQAFTVFAEAIDRSGYARATLAPRAGMSAPVPAMRPRALLTMSEMGHMAGMDGAMGHGDHGPASPEEQLTAEELAALGEAPAAPAVDHSAHTPEQHAAMTRSEGPRAAAALAAAAPGALPVVDHGMGASLMAGHDMGDVAPEGALDGSGRVYGWSNGAPAGSRVLSYADLRSADPQKDTRPAEREIVVRLGGNMERYIWTINGVTFEDAEPIRLRYGERVKLTFINETMMAHPMHLHGMFVQLDNGQPAERLPDKHVVSVAPGRRYSALITADQPGEWAFHCHLLYHMEAGMMSSVVVAKLGEGDAPPAPKADPHAGHGAGS
ncbi:MAG TPA: copper resistance system multicopper oxidase [Caulobacteraceae bacterium]|jgi:CopA family copper-resistance protein